MVAACAAPSGWVLIVSESERPMDSRMAVVIGPSGSAASVRVPAIAAAGTRFASERGALLISILPVGLKAMIWAGPALLTGSLPPVIPSSRNCPVATNGAPSWLSDAFNSTCGGFAPSNLTSSTLRVICTGCSPASPLGFTPRFEMVTPSRAFTAASASAPLSFSIGAANSLISSDTAPTPESSNAPGCPFAPGLARIRCASGAADAIVAVRPLPVSETTSDAYRPVPSIFMFVEFTFSVKSIGGSFVPDAPPAAPPTTRVVTPCTSALACTPRSSVDPMSCFKSSGSDVPASSGCTSAVDMPRTRMSASMLSAIPAPVASARRWPEASSNPAAVARTLTSPAGVPSIVALVPPVIVTGLERSAAFTVRSIGSTANGFHVAGVFFPALSMPP